MVNCSSSQSVRRRVSCFLDIADGCRTTLRTLRAGDRGEGDAAFEPRSRRPHHQPKAIPAAGMMLHPVAVHQLTSAAFAALVTSGELSRSQFCSLSLLKLNQSSPVTLVRPK